MISPLDFWIWVFTSLSVFFDIFVRKIPNWLVLTGLAGGLLFNSVQGLHAFYNSVFGLLLGVAIFFVPFALGYVGAGDVKYFGVVGSLLGFQYLPRVFFYTILTGGLLAVVAIAYNRTNLSISSFLKTVWFDCKLVVFSLGRTLPNDINAKALKGAITIPFGVAIGLGTILAYYVDPNGKWAGF